jgi:hypothetical protein
MSAGRRALVVTTLVVFTACGGTAPDGRTGVLDGTRDASGPSSPDASRPSSRDASRPSSRDASSTPPTDAAEPDAVALDGSSPGPPEDCIPPCLWRLVRQCLPPPSCVSDVADATGESHRCAPGGTWWSHTADQGQAGVHTEVYRDGKLCYSLGEGGAGPPGGKFYTDGSGTFVAWTTDDGTEGSCSWSNGPGAGLRTLFPTRPDCAPWVAMTTPTDCVRGSCPVSPPP